eukprot:TRINITY_DN227_c0_g1_i2.p1 TRINITY_DN227_c0_g1~~TRINITY_DN227_c0_g1_i2.p1  ORF type:complete len:243 (-),score=53.89 TRINITY_DN227_c0_g1_i2:19-747(-)
MPGYEPAWPTVSLLVLCGIRPLLQLLPASQPRAPFQSVCVPTLCRSNCRAAVSAISGLQQREITSADYDLLLQLDDRSHGSSLTAVAAPVHHRKAQPQQAQPAPPAPPAPPPPLQQLLGNLVINGKEPGSLPQLRRAAVVQPRSRPAAVAPRAAVCRRRTQVPTLPALQTFGYPRLVSEPVGGEEEATTDVPQSALPLPERRSAKVRRRAAARHPQPLPHPHEAVSQQEPFVLQGEQIVQEL